MFLPTIVRVSRYFGRTGDRTGHLRNTGAAAGTLIGASTVSLNRLFLMAPSLGPGSHSLKFQLVRKNPGKSLDENGLS